jgi:hypothetical protein
LLPFSKIVALINLASADAYIELRMMKASLVAIPHRSASPMIA